MDCSQIKDVFEKETDEMGTSKSQNTKISDWEKPQKEKHIWEWEHGKLSFFEEFHHIISVCSFNTTTICNITA
jgi:hypothetical protein